MKQNFKEIEKRESRRLGKKAQKTKLVAIRKQDR